MLGEYPCWKIWNTVFRGPNFPTIKYFLTVESAQLCVKLYIGALEPTPGSKESRHHGVMFAMNFVLGM